MSKSSPTKTAPRGSTTVLQAIAIKPSPLPVEGPDGEVTFEMFYVNNQGAQQRVPCTKNVFQQIRDQRLPFNHRDNFRLRCGADGKTVSSIDRYPKPELQTIFKSDSDEADSQFVVMQKHADNSFTTKSQPAGIPQTVVDEISDMLHQHPDVGAEDYVGGRYRVDGVSTRGGVTILYVHPQPK